MIMGFINCHTSRVSSPKAVKQVTDRWSSPAPLTSDFSPDLKQHSCPGRTRLASPGPRGQERRKEGKHQQLTFR